MIGSITLGKKKYPFVFNINTQRTISRKKGFSKLSDFEGWFGKLASRLGGEMSFDDWDDICIVLIAGITVGCRKTGKDDPELSIDDMSEHIVDNPTAIEQAFATISESTERDVKPKKDQPKESK